MRLSEFDYPLPEELIAQEPLAQRDASRMMVVDRAERKISHSSFQNFPEFIKSNDLLIFNESRVIKARLEGNRPSGGAVECFVLSRKSDDTFECLLRSSARKEKLQFSIEGLAHAEVLETGEAPSTYIVKFSWDKVATMDELMLKAGHVPLPPYISRPDTSADLERYQTIFARIQGSVAAPTAGLHFSESILERIRENGVKMEFVLLHVGLGTFQPMKDEWIENHKMHREFFSVSERTNQAIQETKKNGGRIFAIGTTAARALESYARAKAGGLSETSGWTDIFLRPGSKFQIVDALFTNFHQPKSSLLVMLSAFTGDALVKAAYAQALENRYRFLSYGDCMLVL